MDSKNLSIMALKVILTVAISWLLGSFIYYFTFKFFAFSALNTLSLVIIVFLIGLMLKISYANIILFGDILIAIFLSSFYPFGQALIIVLFLIVSEKVLKIF